MNRIKIESSILEIETAIEKATYIADDLADRYGISDITSPSEDDRKIYSGSCGRIYNYIAILNDYITESKNALQELKEICNI